MEIKKFEDAFSVCKIENLSEMNLADEFSFISRTDEELSLVCRTSQVPIHTIERDDGWKIFRIQGQLDFSLIGILAKISGILAENNIGIFAISTYNTDYILTKDSNYEKALSVLKKAGYNII